MKILVVNGPNLQLLGKRKTDIYGKESLADLEEKLKKRAAELAVDLSFFQSCIEGELAEKIGNSRLEGYDGIIVNSAAYTHTSIAIRDALETFGKPIIEVHLSNIYARETFRHKSYISGVVSGVIAGFREYSYILALIALNQILNNQ